MKQLLCLAMLFSLSVKAQTTANKNEQSENTGIHWTEGLSWDEVKAKAKSENKYIFIDAFATWCAPCKLMDKHVYPNDTVGNYFNARFISVKVQMDKTEKDNEYVKKWYKDAATILKQYRLEGYPCFIFFSPEGIIINKEIGYRSVMELITLAQISTKPGQVYNDPYAEYDRLVKEYQNGIKQYDRMPYMIKTAYNLQEDDFGKQLLNEHTDYVARLNKKKRYTKENIEMWAIFTLKSDGKRFRFFYKDGDMIDKIMNKKGYAEAVVSRTIEHEIVWPFFKEQSANSPIKMSIETMSLFDPSQKPDYSEADWKKLYKMIRKQFNKSLGASNVLDAKIKWYDRHKNYNAFTKCQLLKLKKNPPDINDPNVSGIINGIGWTTFLKLKDTGLINAVIYWQEKIIHQYPEWAAGLDTYANLLYKMGRKNEAIEWQIKAVNAQKNKSGKEKLMIIVEQMRRGEPTYLKQGAVWE